MPRPPNRREAANGGDAREEEEFCERTVNESGYRFICAIEVTSETSGRPHTYLRKEADDRKKVTPGSSKQTAEPKSTKLFSE